MQKEQWDSSYSRGDNFLFYPHEEVIRFASKFIRKRVGLDKFKDTSSCSLQPKLLDLGCGIGRHVFFSHHLGLESYGIDLSDTAIEIAWDWADKEKIPVLKERIKQGDIRCLPWEDDFFDFVVSHGVLDSLHYDIAVKATAETARVLKKNGLFYCDIISGDNDAHYREYAGEEIVKTNHETGTIQSYFNYSKMLDLFAKDFHMEEALLIRKENILKGDFSSRYHLTLKKK